MKAERGERIELAVGLLGFLLVALLVIVGAVAVVGWAINTAKQAHQEQQVEDTTCGGAECPDLDDLYPDAEPYEVDPSGDLP